MSRTIVRASILSVFGLMFGSIVTLQAAVLNVPLTIAEHNNWTWPAATQALLKFYGKTGITQTQIINEFNYGIGDRTDASSGLIFVNDTFDGLYHMGEALGTYGAPSGARYYDITSQNAAEQIKLGHPFAIQWRYGSPWDSGSYERYAIFRGFDGTTINETTTKCYLMDPFPGNGYVVGTYQWIKSSGIRSWSASLFTTEYPMTRVEIWGAPVCVNDKTYITPYNIDEREGLRPYVDSWTLNGLGSIAPDGWFTAGPRAGITTVTETVDGISASCEVKVYKEYEAENLVWTSSAVGANVKCEVGASGNKYVQLNTGAKVGDYIEFTVPNVTQYQYNVHVFCKTNTNRGIVELTVDGGKMFNGTFDEYSYGVLHQVQFECWNRAFPVNGSYKLRFTVVGKNDASLGYQMTIDKIRLMPIPTQPVSHEAEKLARTSSAVGTRLSYEPPVNCLDWYQGECYQWEPKASGDYYVEFATTPTAAGQYIEFTCDNIMAAAYNLKVYYKANKNRGKWQAKIDGVNQGAVCDEYNPVQEYQKMFDLGTKNFTAAKTHKIRFTVTGKNALSSGYAMTIDRIDFEPVATPLSKAAGSGVIAAAEPRSFSVVPTQHVELNIFSLSGQLVHSLQTTSPHSLATLNSQLAARNIAAGTYVYSIRQVSSNRIINSGKISIRNKKIQSMTGLLP